ncbi:hypothetical protein [Pseudanabaena yagii]|uniref:Uncharacterized protein n=1 Tax=Pseudanabaena yagii GIHE-NHR1 TaxID=2722753 RepID=A0ABX1LSF4_9CYAN|nr:hypothetical protein [Pseudanabaena yagii]NMF58420.1 hypothetical protein [Pseudanabaena yagii GIHE-NHR1]
MFGDILKKVAKKGFEIVIDEITGQIDVSQFCAKNPPPLPDDITYQDVFQFIAELVPILNYFFTANDILQGNSTKILDKIVGFWLYQKWYENCECSPCPPDTPPPPPSPPKLFDKCPAGYTRERAANDFGIIKKNYLGQVILYNNVFVFETEFVVTELNGTKFVTPPIAGYADGQGFWTNSPSVEIIKETDTTDSYNTVNGVRVQKGTLPSYFIPPCTPIPPPPPPPEFCSLFPDDPLCPHYGCTDPLATNYNPNANINDGSCIYPVYGCTNPNATNYNPDATVDDGSCSFDCQSIDVSVVEFTGCGSDRSSKSVQLFDSGGLVDVSVVEFGGCGSDRSFKSVQLYDCSPSTDFYGCTDPNALNYNPLATIDDGSCAYSFDCTTYQEQYTTWGTNDATYFKSVGWNLETALQDKLAELASSQDYLNHPECAGNFNQWYTDAFNTVVNAP